jgi:hypothetical protein
VDAGLTPDYETIINDFWQRLPKDGSPEVPILTSHLVGLRQIGFEVLNSPELIALT